VDAILATIVGAALTGITVFAYKHPNGYAKIFPPLILIAFATYGGIFIWNVSNSTAFHAVIHYVPFEKFDDAKKAVDDQKILNESIYYFSFIGLFVWLSLLRFLFPDLLDFDKSVRKETNK
jgi:hypothetical protein